MTEAEWLTCTDPQKMLECLPEQLSHRKAMLFACGCCRHVWDQLLSDLARDTVDATERQADALPGGSDILQSFDIWSQIDQEGGWLQNKISRGLYLAGRDGWSGAREVAWETSFLAPRRKERQYQTALLRCIIGSSLFRPVIADPAWLTWQNGTILKLAQAIYQERAFDGLPVLADALEEAGCTNNDILDHCRKQREHVRGCWVVDLILGEK